jgi:hypothetical protein
LLVLMLLSTIHLSTKHCTSTNATPNSTITTTPHQPTLKHVSIQPTTQTTVAVAIAVVASVAGVVVNTTHMTVHSSKKIVRRTIVWLTTKTWSTTQQISQTSDAVAVV